TNVGPRRWHVAIGYTIAARASVTRTRGSARLLARAIAEIVIAAIGAGLVVWALAADRRWFDAHFLPAFFVSRRAYVVAQTTVRVGAAAIGAALALAVRPRVGRLVARHPERALHAAIAAVLAI